MKTIIRKTFLLIIALLIVYAVKCSEQIAWDWANSYGLGGDQKASDMVIDSLGNIYIAGTFSSSSIFGNEQFTANSIYRPNGFIAKFDKIGTLIWANQIYLANEGKKYASAVILDKEQNIYVSGCRLADTSTNGYMYLNKYSNNGETLWSRSFDDYYWDENKHKTLGV